MTLSLQYLQGCGAWRAKKLNSLGVYSLADLLDCDDSLLKQVPGVFDWHIKRWRFHAQLLLDNKSFVQEKPPDKDTFVYYDIETDLGGHLIWLIGVYNPTNDEFKYFLAKNPRDEKQLLTDFETYLRDNGSKTLCSYSTTYFDRRVVCNRLIAHSFKQPYFDTTDEVDLGVFVKKNLYAKLENYKLRTIGDFFGYPWAHKHDINGFDVAWRYMRYQRDKTYKIDWTILLEYNRDDVLVLPHIIKGMHDTYANNGE
jgi:predicted RecB family nuclease